MIKIWLSFFLSVFFAGCSHFEKHWDYKGAHDPSRWHELSLNAKVCRIGHHQSPINIQTDKTLPLEQKLEVFYHKAPLKVINNGYTVEFDTIDSHYILVDEKRYDLLQFHFHAHSEHSINGQYFPVEMHLVHKSDDDEVVVLAVYQDVFESERDHHIFDHIPKKGKVSKVNLNFLDLLPRNRTRYVYDGSLTTPPCTENVTWLIFKNPVQISKKELDLFFMFYTDNYRPTQKEFLRTVYTVNQ